MEDSMTEELKQLVAQTLESDESEWWTTDLTDSYKWLDDEEVYWVIDSETDGSVVAALLSDGSYACLNCADGLSVISTIVAKNIGDDPIESLGIEGLALLVVEWSNDPRAYIATPRFFEKKESELNDWLSGTEKDPQSLSDLCIEPVFNRDESGNWSLVFNMINRGGGIEQWTVKGRSKEFEIESVDRRTLKENGSFYYPDEL